MAVVDIKNLEGKNVGQIDLPDSVYKAKVNSNLLHETVRWYQAAQRAGTHKTKGRGEVSGAVGFRGLQQRHAGTRFGGITAAATGLVGAVDRPD